MATKINTSYYGAESNWGTTSGYSGGAKWAAYSLRQLATGGSWDIANNVDLDDTVIPWGMPECSVSSMAYTLFCNDNGYLKTIIHSGGLKNVPIMFLGGTSTAHYGYSSSSGQSIADARKYQKSRIMGETSVSGSNIIYSNTVEGGATAGDNASYNSYKPITYFNYQQAKLLINTVKLYDKNATGSSFPTKNLNFSDLPTTTETDSEDWHVISVTTSMCAGNNSNANGYLWATAATGYTPPDNLKNRYFDSADTKIMQPYRSINMLGNGWYGLTSNQINPLPSYSAIQSGTKTTSFPAANATTPYCNVSGKRQYFDDVSYHWELSIRYGDSYGNVVYYKNGDKLFTGDPARCCFAELVIDDSIYENKYESYYHAILHEFAFIGLPMIDKSADLTKNIGDNAVFLPEFDIQHMITTGKFKSGSASVSLPNASWADIFDDGVPNWDPNYIPTDYIPIPNINSGITEEITDQSSIEYKRYADTGYTNPNLYRFRDGEVPENDKCGVFIKGTNSYRYTEVRDYIDGSQRDEIP